MEDNNSKLEYSVPISLARASINIKSIRGCKRLSKFNFKNSICKSIYESSFIANNNNGNDTSEVNLCNSSIFVIIKQSRTFKENQVLIRYLRTLAPLVRMLKDAVAEINYESLLKNLSFVLKYLFNEENEIVFKYGDKGDLFYLILKGNVAVLIPKDEKVNLSEEEYFLYLLKLRQFNELEILSNCLIKNKNTYKIDEEIFDEWIVSAIEDEPLDNTKLSKRILKAATMRSNSLYKSPKKVQNPLNKILSVKKVLKEDIQKVYNIISNENSYDIETVNVRDYIDRIKPEMRKNGNERKQVSVWSYNHILSLNDGDKFGDFALDSFSQKRSATIISTQQSHFGIMNKKAYGECIKDVIEKVNKDNRNFIMSLSIFKGFNKSIFIQKYFSFLVLRKVNWNENLIFEGSDPDNLYIIKDGEFDITMYKSLAQIDDLLKILKNGDESHITLFEKEEKWRNQVKFSRFQNEKKPIRIKSVKNYDVLGLCDAMYKNKYLYSVKCVSNKGEVFEVKSKIFKMLCNSDLVVENNVKELSGKKISDLIERLITIRNTRMSFYYSFKNEEVKKKESPKDTQLKPYTNINNYKKSSIQLDINSSPPHKEYSFPQLEGILKITPKRKLKNENEIIIENNVKAMYNNKIIKSSIKHLPNYFEIAATSGEIKKIVNISQISSPTRRMFSVFNTANSKNKAFEIIHAKEKIQSKVLSIFNETNNFSLNTLKCKDKIQEEEIKSVTKLESQMIMNPERENIISLKKNFLKEKYTDVSLEDKARKEIVIRPLDIKFRQDEETNDNTKNNDSKRHRRYPSRNINQISNKPPQSLFDKNLYKFFKNTNDIRSNMQEDKVNLTNRENINKIKEKSKLFSNMPIEPYSEKTNIVDCLVMDDFNRVYNTQYYYSNVFNTGHIINGRSISHKNKESFTKSHSNNTYYTTSKPFTFKGLITTDFKSITTQNKMKKSFFKSNYKSLETLQN